jgi:multidrug efflux pump
MGALRDAQVFALVPSAVRGLGASSGFTMELQNVSGMSRDKFAQARDQLLAMAGADQRLTGVRLSDLPDVSTLNIDADPRRLAAFGLSQSDVNSTLSTAWGGSYVNDFLDKGRVKRVYVQGDAPFRTRPEDLGQWYVRSSNGEMAPFSAFARTGWSTVPSTTSRFNGVQSYEFSGQAAPGISSGTAMDIMAQLAAKIPGTAVAWAGSSYQERLSSGQAPLLYALSLLVVFLCLAALYESWSVPVSVMLVVPLGVFGAVLAATLTGVNNNIYFQVGLITTIGVSAKNAILIVEFAEERMREGMNAFDAAVAAARLRLRPILMTSFAFIFGVFPLAIATGAGSGGQNAIGRSVVGGMLAATVFGIFFVPMFFVAVRRLFERRKDKNGEGDVAEAQA